MKLLIRLLSIALFIVFFDFALKNTDEVVLSLFWNSKASAPLILLLLGFLLLGLMIGVLAMMSTLLRYRRELLALKREAEQQKQSAAEVAKARTQPPAPESLVEQVGL
jgi:lipopolysaccharide assembly protein A